MVGGPVDEWIDEWMVGSQTDERLNGQVQVGVWMEGQMGGQEDGKEELSLGG